MNKLWYRILGLLIAGLIIYLLFDYYGLSSFLSLDGFNRYHQEILTFEQDHATGFMMIYIISYIVLIACCIPGTILFDLIAGFIYGPVVGTVIVVFSYLVGAVVNFLLVRSLFKDILLHKFADLRYLIVKDGLSRQAIYNLIGLRLIPVIPFWLINILAAIIGIPLLTFAITTFVGIIPTSVVYVLLGNGVKEQMLQNKGISIDTLLDPYVWVPLILLAMLILVPNIYKMIKKGKTRP